MITKDTVARIRSIMEVAPSCEVAPGVTRLMQVIEAERKFGPGWRHFQNTFIVLLPSTVALMFGNSIINQASGCSVQSMTGTTADRLETTCWSIALHDPCDTRLNRSAGMVFIHSPLKDASTYICLLQFTDGHQSES